MEKTVWTHAGPAHMDDFLSCCLIAAWEVENAECEFRIIRSNNNTPADVVVDVGGEYDPARGRFDHHQLDKAGNGVCSLHLVSKALGLDLSPFPWAEVCGILDCGDLTKRKPLNPAAWGGNPLIRFALDWFSSVGEIRYLASDGSPDQLMDLLVQVGVKILRECAEFQESVDIILNRKIQNNVADGRGISSFAATNAVGERTDVEFMVVTGREPGTINVLKKGQTPLPESVTALSTFTHPAGFMSVIKESDFSFDLF